jgi:membrane protein
MSAAMSFRTIFALIPAIVLAVLVLKAVGVLEDGKQSFRQFLVGSGLTEIAVVAQGEESTTAPSDESAKVFNVADEIEVLVERVEAKLTFGRIGPIGALLFIWTALTLLTTIERSLNRIFGARRARPIARRVLLYWSVLTLGPLVLIVVGYLSRRATQVLEDAVPWLWALTFVVWAAPIVVGILVLALLYKHMPNTNVPYRSAIGGAVVAVPLWLVAKWAFALYVSKLVGSGNVYGALGLLPLFLVWLNLSWTILLFGAQLAHAATHLGDPGSEETQAAFDLGPSDLLATAIAVAQPYMAGRGPVCFDEIVHRLALPSESVQRLLDRLNAAMIVCPTDGDSDLETSYVLGKPADKITILEIAGVDGPSRTAFSTRRHDSQIRDSVEGAWELTRSAIGGFTLAEAIAKNNPDPDESAADIAVCD